ncbi:TonB-dependent receptor [Colwelliaceae bacterium 6441]
MSPETDLSFTICLTDAGGIGGEEIMNKTFLTSSIIAACTLNTLPLLANDSTFADEHIVVTANRTASNIDEVLVSQVVITREEIEKIQAKSVIDLLATVSGIDTAISGGRGQTASVFMRGANSEHTLVLINGVRIGSATLGSSNLNEISPELIDRIEIVKGPRAALWGSDAIGGVIQIFTRKLTAGEHFVNAAFGSENYQKYGAGVGFEHGDGFTSFSVSHEESDGFDVKDDNETDDDGFSYDALAVNGQQQMNEAFSVNWLAQVNQGHTEYDSSGKNESEVNNYIWHVGAAYQSKIADYENHTQLSIGKSRTSNRSYGNGANKSDGDVFDTRRDHASLLNHTVFSPSWQLSVGADFYDEQLKGSNEYANKHRNTLGTFAHTVYNQGQLTYELALRYDDVEGIDSESTYNASVAYQLSDDTRINFSTGTGFKAPTFNDLYYPLNWGYIGNKDLVSETSESFELNLISQFNQLMFSFNLHKTAIDNLIDWSGTDIEGNTTPINVDEVEIEGAELGLNYQGLGGTHQMNVSYVNAKDANAKPNEIAQLIRRAKQFASYKFTTEIANTDVYLEWQYKGKRYDSVWGLGKVKVDGYQLVNLGASYPLTKKIKIEAKVNNAFNEQYQTIHGYFTQDRTVYLGINYQN